MLIDRILFFFLSQKVSEKCCFVLKITIYIAGNLIIKWSVFLFCKIKTWELIQSVAEILSLTLNALIQRCVVHVPRYDSVLCIENLRFNNANHFVLDAVRVSDARSSMTVRCSCFIYNDWEMAICIAVLKLNMSRRFSKNMSHSFFELLRA